MAQGLLSYSQGHLMGFPALPFPVPMIGLLTLMAGNFKVSLNYCNIGTERKRDRVRNTGHMVEATSPPAPCLQHCFFASGSPISTFTTSATDCVSHWWLLGVGVPSHHYVARGIGSGQRKHSLCAEHHLTWWEEGIVPMLQMRKLRHGKVNDMVRKRQSWGRLGAGWLQAPPPYPLQLIMISLGRGGVLLAPQV